MASSASQKPPTFVFGYLPNQSPSATAALESSSSVSIYDKTSAFLSSLTKAVTPSPRFSIEQQRSATLQQVKAGLEGHIDAKRKAGIAVSGSEWENVSRVEEAMRGFSRDT